MPVKIKKATFVESNVHHIPHQNLLEHFVISINGERIRVYLRRYDVDPQTGRTIGARDLTHEQALIESFNPGDSVDLTVNANDWRLGRRSGTKHHLLSIARSS
jgi:hypothetical protein